jgi:octopine/nopaline transport system substrate-binding protein
VRLTRLLRAAVPAMLALAATHAASAKEWSRVVIATEGAYPPYNQHLPDGTLAGYEIDLGNDLCRRMKVQCQFVAQDWDGIIPGLLAGKYDAIMSGMSITPKRLQVIAFSLPYANSPTTFAALKGDPLASLPDTGKRVSLDDKAALQAALDAIKPKLKGKTIGVQVATIQADFLNTYLKDTVDIRTYKTTEEHDLDLHDGRVDGELASAANLKAFLDKPDSNLVFTGPMFVGGLLGQGSAVGLRKDDTDLKAMFDRAIREAAADGTLRTLSMKWFKIDIAPQY